MTRSPLRVGFAGTPAFAAASLSSLIGAGYTIPVVLTQPDRPKGRGLATAMSEVKALASGHHLPLLQPASLCTQSDRQALLAFDIDVLVVAAYGLILPAPVLAWPRHGCINVHASLLPRWRGAAPIARAIEAGDTQSGITIMQMDEGLDTGPIIERVPLTINDGETAGSLSARLAALGASAITRALAALAHTGALCAVPQAALGASHARKLSRAQARIEWSHDAVSIERAVRAFDPWPAAWTMLDGKAVKIWRANALPAAADHGVRPGTVLRAQPQGLDVACGAGVIRVEEVQPANARRMHAAAFVAGCSIAAGEHFE